MQYLDSDDEMKELMEAADHIKGWAHEQMGAMRRPNKPADPMHDEGGESPREESMESPEMERHEMDSGMEQPMDTPPPRDMGKPMKSERTIMEIIEPGVGMSRPKPKDDENMDEWSNETVRKLDKFGKKLPRR